MAETLSKLDQLKNAEKQLSAMKKQADLVRKIIEWHKQEKNNEYPPIGIKVNPFKTTDIIWLEERYMPFNYRSLMDKYLQNMEEHAAQLQNEIDTFLNPAL